MELDTATNPEPVEAEEVASAEAPETEPDTDETELADGETLTQEEEIEYEEVERNGKRFKVPKELAPELMMQADYTRKTQETAELRKAVAAEREAVQRERTMYSELQDEALAVREIDQRLEYLQQINPYQLTPEQQAQYSVELSRLQMDRQARMGAYQHKAQTLEQETSRRKAETLQRSYGELQKPDPNMGWQGGFDAAKSQEITRFLQEHGVPIDEILNINQPWQIKMMHLAKVGKDYLQKQRSTPVRPQAQPAAKAPTAKTSTMPSDPAKWSVQQMAKHLKQSKVI